MGFGSHYRNQLFQENFKKLEKIRKKFQKIYNKGKHDYISTRACFIDMEE